MKCSICSSESDIQKHHLLPKSQWGENDFVIPLCRKHHNKIHNIECHIIVNHSELTKRGLEKKIYEDLTALAGIFLMWAKDYYEEFSLILPQSEINYMDIWKYWQAFCTQENVDNNLFSYYRFRKITRRIIEIMLTDYKYFQWIAFNRQPGSTEIWKENCERSST